MWSRRPSADQWSPAECVAHLNLTSDAMLPKFREALEDARRLGQPAPGTYRRDLVGWMIWKSLKPGNRVKTKTIAAFVTAGSRPASELVAGFERLHRDLIALIGQADGLPIDRVKIVSPFNERAKYNLYAAFTINARHDHRHLLQAERAAEARP